MDQITYTKAALATESKPETLKISLASLDMALVIGIATGEVMNKLKRAMFYGKPVEKDELLDALDALAQTSMCLGEFAARDLLQDDATAAALIEKMPSDEQAFYANGGMDKINKRLLHGVIGEMSETAEKFEALRSQLLGKPLDVVNFAEEMGDNEWYTAIQYDELAVLAQQAAAESFNAQSNDGNAGLAIPFDVSQAAVRVRNIAKLQARNKGKKFNAEATLNRDTAAERVILESTDVGTIDGSTLVGIENAGATLTVGSINVDGVVSEKAA